MHIRVSGEEFLFDSFIFLIPVTFLFLSCYFCLAYLCSQVIASVPSPFFPSFYVALREELIPDLSQFLYLSFERVCTACGNCAAFARSLLAMQFFAKASPCMLSPRSHDHVSLDSPGCPLTFSFLLSLELLRSRFMAVMGKGLVGGSTLHRRFESVQVLMQLQQIFSVCTFLEKTQTSSSSQSRQYYCHLIHYR